MLRQVHKLHFIVACCISSLFFFSKSYAQLPDCSSGMIYYISGGHIYNYDPLQPYGPTNPLQNTITPPSGAAALAINDNINGPGPSPTFYCVAGAGSTYWYYDGAAWVNTGHTAGAINPGGAGPYIYSLEGGGGNVYKYDGTGNAVFLLTLPGFSGGGPFDLVGGCSGHFFALRTQTPQWMHEYDANGNQVNAWTLTNAPSVGSGGGFSIIGDKVYYTNNGDLMLGTITGTNIDVVTWAGPLSPGPEDFGTCPSYVGGIYASIDTGYYCNAAVNIPVSVTGNGPFTWTVINGPAVITGSGANVTVSSTAFSQFTVTGTGGGCGTGTDTVTFIIPKATVDAGLPDTIYNGCLDTLHGSYSGTTPGVTYNVDWQPAASIVTGGNTLTPVIDPTVPTTFIMTVSTPATQGGCSWVDSVHIHVLQASSVTASIDTVYYCGSGPGINITAVGTPPLIWTAISGNPVITGSGSSVTVTATTTSRIKVSNPNICGVNSDTVTIVVPTATLDAGVTDTIFTGCGTTTATLQASLTNTLTWLPYNISWTPAGQIVSGATTVTPVVNPISNTTFYITVSTAANKGGCTWKDSVDIGVTDASVNLAFTSEIKYGCLGDSILLTNTSTGNTSNLWDFGDTTVTSLLTNPVHVYEHQGTHTLELVISNGHCADSLSQTININHSVTADFSYTIDLDSVCQGAPIDLINNSTAVNTGNVPPTYTWIFDDGETSTEPNPTHLYHNSGIYHLVLIATDLIPCNDTLTKTVEIDSLVYNSTIQVNDTALCLGEPLNVVAEYEDYTLRAVHWDMGDGINIDNVNKLRHSYQQPGTYLLTFIADYNVCPDDTITKTIKVYPYPMLDLGRDTSICPNAGPMLLRDHINASDAGASWLWNTGSKAPYISVTEPGTYTTTVTKDGCSTADTIEVRKDCYVDIPNTFTPNGDGTNDYFFPRNLLSRGVVSFKMSIFNRWGQLIYEAKSLDGRGWDGKFNDVPQPQGVFVYVIDASFTDGRTEKYQGNVTLLR